MTIIKKERRTAVVSTSRFEFLEYLILLEYLIIKDKKGNFSGTVKRREEGSEEEKKSEQEIKGEEKHTADQENQTAKIKRRATVEQEQAAEEELENEDIERKSLRSRIGSKIKEVSGAAGNHLKNDWRRTGEDFKGGAKWAAEKALQGTKSAGNVIAANFTNEIGFLA